jgi:hypothetical protein
MVPNIGTILSPPQNPLNFSLFTIDIERQQLRKQERRPCMTTVTREELKAKMDRGDSFRLVEALPEASFLEGHLPGAVNIPKGSEKVLAQRLLPDKAVEVIVYCSKFT